MILVTGASGTLGKEVSRQLAQKKLQFRCLVRKTSKTEELEKIGANLCYGDVTDRESFKEAMQGVDSVISTHTLGMQKKGFTFWEVDYKGNFDLIESLKENGGGKFIFISGLGVSLNSRFPLYRVKQLVENLLKTSGLDYTIFRPSGFFSDFTMTAEFAKKRHLYPVMGVSNHQVQGIHMRDLACCVIESLSNSKASHQTFQIGGPEVLTYRKIVSIYSEVLGYKVRLLPIPLGFIKAAGWMVDAFTGYRYSIQGFVDAFSKDSVCDNEPLLNTFDVKFRTFEEYLRDFFAKN